MAQAAGVPTVPGSDGLVKSEAEALEVARQVTFPVMIKATAGGGGRGMRLAMTEDDFLPLLQQAQQEADACFGNSAVYLEKYVTNPRHIEFQACTHAPPKRNISMHWHSMALPQRSRVSSIVA